MVCGIWMVKDLVVLLATTLALVLPALVGLAVLLALPLPPPAFFGGPVGFDVVVVEDDEVEAGGAGVGGGGGVEGLREGDAKSKSKTKQK